MNITPIKTSHSVKQANVQRKTVPIQISVNHSKLSFKGIEQSKDYEVQQLKESKYTITNKISDIFKVDRTIIDNSFTGIVNSDDKFSKLGYYLSSKENKNDELSHFLQNQNLRKLNKEYNDFYNTNLKSYSKVSKGQKKYCDDSLNNRLKNGDIDNYTENELDKFFADKMAKTKLQNQTNDDSYLHSDFAQKRLREFVSLFKENPIMMSKNNLSFVFDVINKQLDFAGKDEYDEIYNNLDNLSEALYEHDKNLMLESWKKLTKSTVDFYKTDYLKAVVNDKDEKVKKLNEFLHSGNYKALNSNNKLSMIFEYRGSGELTLSEKVFLIDKYNQAEENKKSYGIDMLDFLSARPANNKIRKQIVKNLVESQEFAQDNFNDLKGLFVQDINNKNYDSNMFNIKINKTSIVDLVLEEMNAESYNLSPKNKIDYLAGVADEDIEKCLNKLKKSWMEEKFINALNFESDKYDLAKQSDNILKTLTVDVDGKEMNINEFLDSAIKNIYGQNADILTNSKNILSYANANNKLIREDLTLGKKEYESLLNHVDLLLQSMASHDEKTENFHKQISKELDKLEMNCPWLKPQVKDTRSVFEKIKDGLLNEKNIIPFAAAGNIISNSLITTGSATAKASGGEPQGLVLGAVIMLIGYASLIGINIYREIKKG